MRHGSLFSGGGGFDLAAEWMRWDNIFHCEWNPFGQRILKHYWPHAKSYDDITQTDFTIHRGGIDILTGGFPCQPYSQAGQRKGKEDERHLWPHMLRAIKEIQPGWIVGENVLGLLNWNGGMVFDEVCADLEAAGYYNQIDSQGKRKVIPIVLPAAGVNAPHQRYRVWFVAFNPECQPNGGYNAAAGSGKGMDMVRNILDATRWNKSANNPESSDCNAPYSKGIRLHGGTDNRDQCTGQARTNEQRENKKVWSESGAHSGNASNTDGKQLEGLSIGRGNDTQGRENAGRQSGEFACDDWSKWPTQPPVCSGNDGLPSGLDGITISQWKKESIKMAGNAIVPQEAYQIFKAIPPI